VGAIQRPVWQLRLDQPINDIAFMDATVQRSVAQPRFSMTLMIPFCSLRVPLLRQLAVRVRPDRPGRVLGRRSWAGRGSGGRKSADSNYALVVPRDALVTHVSYGQILVDDRVYPTNL
jgi:hypothetical protein